MRSFAYRLTMRLSLSLFVAAAAFAAQAAEFNPPTLKSSRGAWPVVRQWTHEEIQHFARWIENIYEVKLNGTREQQLAKLERVLTDPEMNLLLDPAFAGESCNPQLGIETIRGMHRIVDCAKLTVALSGYYAYRRGLPWMTSSVRGVNGGDVRIVPATVPSNVASILDYSSPHAFFMDAIVATCTGNFRVEPKGPGAQLSDTVPVAIDPRHLRPGTLYYLDGHVLIVGKITKDGEPRFIDSTTSPTRNIYVSNGFNAVSGLTPCKNGSYEGCYRGFRAYRWPIAVTDANGNVTSIRRRTDEEMMAFGYSTEQYEKLEQIMAKRPVVERGVKLNSFQDFFRARMRPAGVTNVLHDIQLAAADMIKHLQQREQHVQKAWQHASRQGVAFPEDQFDSNVFTARGPWGEHSTALDDAAFRAKYVELVTHLDNVITWFNINRGDINTAGLSNRPIKSQRELAQAIIAAKDRVFAGAPISYTNSRGEQVHLNLLEVEKRLFDLSFDPNHPPELRWGAAPGTGEAQFAMERSTPVSSGPAVAMLESYQRQAYYRSLDRWEPEESYLRSMFTEGFLVREKINDHIRTKWLGNYAPPLVPRDGNYRHTPRGKGKLIAETAPARQPQKRNKVARLFSEN
jgi:hypothetical protein